MNNIIFFDGYCNLCNGFVDFLIRHDKKGVLHFASLQGQTAKELLPKKFRENKNTVVFLNSEKHIFTKSTATIEILLELSILWKWIVILKIIPIFIRDAIYKLLATNRFKWFGKRTTCRVPTAEEETKIFP